MSFIIDFVCPIVLAIGLYSIFRFNLQHRGWVLMFLALDLALFALKHST